MTTGADVPTVEMVEAAAKVLYLNDTGIDWWEYEQAPVRDAFRKLARRTLKAVASLIAAERDRAVDAALERAAKAIEAETHNGDYCDVCAARIVRDERRSTQ